MGSRPVRLCCDGHTPQYLTYKVEKKRQVELPITEGMSNNIPRLKSNLQTKQICQFVTYTDINNAFQGQKNKYSI